MSSALTSLGPRTTLSSVLTLTPRLQDHGTNLTCQVAFPGAGVTVQKTVLIIVTCEFNPGAGDAWWLCHGSWMDQGLSQTQALSLSHSVPSGQLWGVLLKPEMLSFVCLFVSLQDTAQNFTTHVSGRAGPGKDSHCGLEQQGLFRSEQGPYFLTLNTKTPSWETTAPPHTFTAHSSSEVPVPTSSSIIWASGHTPESLQG